MTDDEVIDAELVEPGSALEHTGDAVSRIASEIGLADLRRGLTVLDDVRKALVEQRDVDRLAHGAADVQLLVGDLQALKRQTESDIAGIMLADHVDGEGKSLRGNPKREVPGLGIIDVPGGSERKNWESERLLRHLMFKAVADEETGELLDLSAPEMVDAIFTVLNECLPITASLGWRVGQIDKATNLPTGLKKYDIDPDDWCDKLDKPRLAKIPKKNQETT